MRRIVADLAIMLLTSLAVACTEPEAESAAETPARTIDAPPTHTGDPAPPSSPNALPEGDWTAGITEQEKRVTGAPMVDGFRVEESPDFDRIVLEFAGDDIPSYRIEYVDRPIRQCGSGNIVELRGAGWLSIRLDPAVAHTDEGRPSVENRAGDVDQPVILEHRLLCDFEGQVEWVLGVASPNRYRVLELVEPARLIIDILN